MGRLLRYDEVKRYIEIDSNSGCKLLSMTYESSKSKMLFLCSCGKNTFFTTFNRFKCNDTRRCRDCTKLKRRKSSRARTHNEFVNELNKAHPDQYEVLGKYLNSTSKIKVKHLKCSNIYEVGANSLLRNGGCGFCYPNRKKTTEEFKKRVFEKVGNDFSVMSEYNGNTKKIIMKHNNENCNYSTFPTTPVSFMKFLHCPFCGNNIRHRDTEMFRDEVKSMTGGEYVLIGEYIKSQTKTKIKHNKCENVFLVTPGHFLFSNSRCP